MLLPLHLDPNQHILPLEYALRCLTADHLKALSFENLTSNLELDD